MQEDHGPSGGCGHGLLMELLSVPSLGAQIPGAADAAVPGFAALSPLSFAARGSGCSWFPRDPEPADSGRTGAP